MIRWTRWYDRLLARVWPPRRRRTELYSIAALYVMQKRENELRTQLNDVIVFGRPPACICDWYDGLTCDVAGVDCVLHEAEE